MLFFFELRHQTEFKVFKVFFQVDENDLLPKIICKKCSQNIVCWFLFKTLTENAYDTWMEMLSIDCTRESSYLQRKALEILSVEAKLFIECSYQLNSTSDSNLEPETTQNQESRLNLDTNIEDISNLTIFTINEDFPLNDFENEYTKYV